jgi:hypothetical protein
LAHFHVTQAFVSGWNFGDATRRSVHHWEYYRSSEMANRKADSLTGLSRSTRLNIFRQSRCFLVLFSESFSTSLTPPPLRGGQLRWLKPFGEQESRFLPQKQAQTHSRLHEADTASTRTQARGYCSNFLVRHYQRSSKPRENCVYYAYIYADPPFSVSLQSCLLESTREGTNPRCLHRQPPK